MHGLRNCYIIPLLLFLLVGLLAGCSKDHTGRTVAKKTPIVQQKSEKATPKAEPTPSVKPTVQPVRGGTLRYCLANEPLTLNPLQVNDISSYLVTYLMFEPLIETDRNLHYVPRLASSWEISDSAQKIVFHLRKGVKWHDGTPFTAKDVLFTFNRAISKKNPNARFKGIFKDVLDFHAPDSHTLVVTYRIPLASALEAWSSLLIMPEHYYKKVDFTKQREFIKPIGTGPFVFKTWKRGKLLEFTANENHWYHRPYLDGIQFKIISSENIAYRTLVRNELDGMEVSPSLWARYAEMVSRKRNFESYKFPTLNFFVIAWNNKKEIPFFHDKRVRRALTLAIDRRSIIQKLLLGLADTLTGPFSPYSWAYDHTLRTLPFDPKKSIELLSQAGWKDSDSDGILDKGGISFKFQIIIPNNNRVIEQVVTMIQYNLEMIGIIMDIQRLEPAAFMERMNKRDFQATFMALILSIDPDMYQLLHSSQIDGGFNVSCYNNPTVDHLLEEGRKTLDKEKRKQIYHRIHRIVYEDQPYTFLFTRPQLYFFRKNVHNIQVSPLPLYLFFPGILDWYMTP